MQLTVWFEFNPAYLADIEKGGPIRRYETKVLHNAIGMANLVLMSSGQSMSQGPRKIAPISTVVFADTERVVIRIQRGAL